MIQSWLKSVPVAHRGLHDIAKGVPENSVAAFRAAIEAGFAIECDVRLAADGVPMVFHDGDLKRLTGTEGQADALTSAELGKLSILGTAEKPPTFAAFLDLVAGRVPLLIEVKNYGDATAEKLAAATWSVLKDYTGAYAVQSFAPDIVAWFKGHAPHVARGQIATDPDTMTSLTEAERAVLKGKLATSHGDPDFIAYDVKLLPAPLTDRARTAGKPVLTWTVKTPEQRAVAEKHADNMIFEGFRP